MNKEKDLLRVGILGCGPIAQYTHLECCRKGRNTQLYAVCDQAADLVEKMKVIHQPIVAYTEYENMLNDMNVDAIIVAAADQFHVELAKKALQAGKHVLVEKPLGVTIEECEEIRKIVHNSSLILQVGNNKRFDPGVTFARNFIEEEMGELLSVNCWYRDSIYRYTMVDNLLPLVYKSKNAKKPVGNPKEDYKRYYLFGHASHLVDTACFLSGNDIVEVHTELVERCDSYCWFILTKFIDGSIGHLDLSIPINGDWSEGFEIYGENGNVRGKLFLPYFYKSSEVEYFTKKDGVYRKPLGEDGHSYRRQLEGFADTILHGEPQLGANVDEGTQVVRALVAISKSSELHKPVRLDEVSGGV